tara:strand:- start:108 stop:950 length:843 start_codon:yes stop_codon:yes gene_type:complete
MQRPWNTKKTNSLLGWLFKREESLPNVIMLRLLVVGDKQDGKKTQLLDRYMEYMEDSQVETYPRGTDFYFFEKMMYLEVQDSTGAEHYDRLKPLLYQRGDIVMLTFDFNTPSTLDDLPSWIAEARHYSYECTFVLVGLTDTKRNNVDDREINAKIEAFYKEYELNKPIICDLDDIETIKSAFSYAMLRKMITIPEAKNLLTENSKAVKRILNPEKEAFLNMARLIVAGNKKNPDSALNMLPKDMLVLLIKHTAQASNLPYNQKIVDDFLKTHEKRPFNIY